MLVDVCKHGWFGALLCLASACASGSGDARASHAIAAGAGGGAIGGGGAVAPPIGDAPALPVNGGQGGAPGVELPEGACVSTGTIEATLRKTSLLFLIDRSGSMSCNPPPISASAACEANPARAQASAASKWEIVRDVLKATLASLPPKVNAAITYFSNDDLCGVQSLPHVPMAALDAGQLMSLSRSLDATQPRGGTPLVGGLILAFKQLNPDQTPDVPGGKRFVVLITDGQEGCAPYETERLLETELPKAAAASIATFVIGVPGSEVSRGFLSQLAFAGGTPSREGCDHGGADPMAGDCHFDMTEDPDLAAGLGEALRAISGRSLSCELAVPQPAVGALDHEKVNVVYKMAPDALDIAIGQDASRPCDGGANGWQYNDDKSAIRICGDACRAVRGAASITLALGCESFKVQ